MTCQYLFEIFFWAYSPRVVPHFYSVPRWGLWFTFIYRNHVATLRLEALTRLSWKDLHRSHGLRLFTVAFLDFWIYYSTLGAICQELFLKVLEDGKWGSNPHLRPTAGVLTN